MTIEEGKIFATVKLNSEEEIQVKTFSSVTQKGTTQFVDIRKFVVSPKYTGYTKQGIPFPKAVLAEVIEALKKIP